MEARRVFVQRDLPEFDVRCVGILLCDTEQFAQSIHVHSTMYVTESGSDGIYMQVWRENEGASSGRRPASKR